MAWYADRSVGARTSRAGRRPSIARWSSRSSGRSATARTLHRPARRGGGSRTGAVGEEIEGGTAPLAPGGDPRPVRRGGLVVGPLAAFREPVDDRRRDA